MEKDVNYCNPCAKLELSKVKYSKKANKIRKISN